MRVQENEIPKIPDFLVQTQAQARLIKPSTIFEIVTRGETVTVGSVQAADQTSPSYLKIVRDSARRSVTQELLIPSANDTDKPFGSTYAIGDGVTLGVIGYVKDPSRSYVQLTMHDRESKKDDAKLSYNADGTIDGIQVRFERDSESELSEMLFKQTPRKQVGEYIRLLLHRAPLVSDSQAMQMRKHAELQMKAELAELYKGKPQAEQIKIRVAAAVLYQSVVPQVMQSLLADANGMGRTMKHEAHQATLERVGMQEQLTKAFLSLFEEMGDKGIELLMNLASTGKDGYDHKAVDELVKLFSFRFREDDSAAVHQRIFDDNLSARESAVLITQVAGNVQVDLGVFSVALDLYKALNASRSDYLQIRSFGGVLKRLLDDGSYQTIIEGETDAFSIGEKDFAISYHDGGLEVMIKSNGTLDRQIQFADSISFVPLVQECFSLEPTNPEAVQELIGVHVLRRAA